MTEKVTKKEVTREAFAEFLVWLSPERENSGEAYERLRFRLQTFFAQRKARFPEDLADETINRVALKIGGETIDNKMAFIYGFAKNVFLESLRKEKSYVPIDEMEIAAQEPEKEIDFSGDCLDKCLNELPDDNRILILDYFSEKKRAKIDLRRDLSSDLETTQTALRMRIVRIKQKLKVCTQDCLAV